MGALLLAIAACSLHACSRNYEPDDRSAPSSSDAAPQPPTQAPAPPEKAATAPKQPRAVIGYKGPLPAVPMSPYAAAPPGVLYAVYEFAARRPDVMRHVPCFCGCERNGHQDNEDCFVASRGTDGRPEWDDHGLT